MFWKTLRQKIAALIYSPPPPSIDLTFAACCLWEAMLDMRHDDVVVEDAFCYNGFPEMRKRACILARACEADFRIEYSGEGETDHFADEYVPLWLKQSCIWSATGPVLRPNRQITPLGSVL